MDEATAKPELLPHAARQFFRRAVGKGREPGAVQKLADFRVPFGARLPEQAPKELDILPDAQVRVEIFPRPCGM